MIDFYFLLEKYAKIVGKKNRNSKVGCDNPWRIMKEALIYLAFHFDLTEINLIRHFKRQRLHLLCGTVFFKTQGI